MELIKLKIISEVVEIMLQTMEEDLLCMVY